MEDVWVRWEVVSWLHLRCEDGGRVSREGGCSSPRTVCSCPWRPPWGWSPRGTRPPGEAPPLCSIYKIYTYSVAIMYQLGWDDFKPWMGYLCGNVLQTYYIPVLPNPFLKSFAFANLSSAENFTSLALINKFFIQQLLFTLGHAKNWFCNHFWRPKRVFQKVS